MNVRKEIKRPFCQLWDSVFFEPARLQTFWSSTASGSRMFCWFHGGAAALGFADPLLSLPASSILKREKRLRTKNVHFSCVTVYYFTRRQGFTSVPSQGGSTLGMSSRHNSVRQYTLGEFAREQERLHREMLREHLREEKLNSLKLKVKLYFFFFFCKNLIFSHPLG